MNSKEENLGVSVIEHFDNTLGEFAGRGIHNLEFRIVHGDDRELIKGYVDKIVSEKQKYDINTPTVHLPHKEGCCFDLSALCEEERLAAIENYKALTEIALPLMPEIVVVHPSVGEVHPDDYQKRKNALIKSLKDFCPWCKRHGVKVAVENLTQISSVQSGEDLVEIVESVGDNIGICFDVNHLFVQSHSDFIKKAGKHIITMHISDNDGVQERHRFPGDGVIDWKALFEDLRSIDYSSYMIFECSVFRDFPASVDELCRKWRSVH